MSEADDSIRVSDAERDATLRTLGDHAAVGRLTLDELEDRASRALAAKTRGELAVLTGDLPQEAAQAGPPEAPQAAAPKPVRWMVAIMGGSRRHGRFRTVGAVNSVSIMGGDEIDLREAEIEGGHLMLNMFALMGGNTEIGSQRAPRPGAPVVQIRTYNLMGGATIYRLPSARTRSPRPRWNRARRSWCRPSARTC